MKFEPWMLAALDEAGYNDSCSDSKKEDTSEYDETEVSRTIELDKLAFVDVFNENKNTSDRLTEEDLLRLQIELSDYLS